MAIALGMENKRQVYLVGSLFAVVIAIAAWEIFGGSSTPARLPAPSNSAGSQHASGPARRSGVAGLEPKLQVGRLARSEQVEYATTGRNIFSGESAPVKIEVPVASPRPNDTAASTAPPEPPKPPEIDLKYLGYVQGGDKSYDALLIHGDDSFIARNGEIIFHRYKVGIIQPSGVPVTDLKFNTTKTIILTEK